MHDASANGLRSAGPSRGRARAEALTRLFSPRSVAIVGASDDLRKPGGRIVASLCHNGFAGEILPVNPNRLTIQGRPAYRSLVEIGRAVDLVIVSLPAPEVEGQVRLGLEAGAGAFVIFSSGFAEQDEAGRERQYRLARLVQDHGVPIVGPNCLGVMNGSIRLVASSTVIMEGRRLPPGKLSFVSQSGAIGTYWLDMAIKAGYGISKWISTGNEADVDLAEVLEYLVEDDETEVIGMYVEGVRDGMAFRRAARKALERRKPVLVLKSGRSRAGAAAAASHTGALAGEDDLYQAFFDQFGICRVESLSEMIDVSRLFLAFPFRSGRRTCVLSVSGGAGVLLTDAAVSAGLEIPDLSAESKEKLRALLPEFAQPQNPIDLTAQIVVRSHMFEQALEIVTSSDCFDGILMFIGGLEQIGTELTTAMAKVLPRWGRPCAVVWQAVAPEAISKLASSGIPVYGEIPQAVRAFAAAMKTAERWDRPTPPLQHHPVITQQGRTQRVLTEYESKSYLLDRAGLQHPGGVLVRSVESLSTVIAGLRPPFAAKLQSADMLHKSGHGGIALNLQDVDSARDAAAKMLCLAHERNLQCEGVLIEEMKDIEFEFLVGLRYDPVFGPFLVVGRGGITVEVDPDIAKAFLPLTAAEVEALFARLRMQALIKGFRGRRAVPIHSLANAVARLAEVFAMDPALSEIEINPLAIDRNGNICVIDALIRGSTEQARMPL